MATQAVLAIGNLWRCTMERTKAAERSEAGGEEWEAHAEQRAHAGAIDADRSVQPPSDVHSRVRGVRLARVALAEARRARDREAISALTRAVERLTEAVEELAARVPDSAR